MRLNAGILTEKLLETEKFYTQILDFKIEFSNEFYLLLSTPNAMDKLSFLLPNHETQDPFFYKPYQNQGMYLTIAVENVDKMYSKIKNLDVIIKVDIRNEPWGERHFAIQDPNGIGIDIIQYVK